MASYSDEDIQRVREATDLVELIGEVSPVKQRGKDFWCCCPVHSEKTPSCKIDTVLQLWHCFGCGEGGDAFSYVMKTQEVSFPEAIEYLAERAHLDIQPKNTGVKTPTSPKARLREICKLTADYYHFQLMRVQENAIEEARRYLSSRNLGGEVPTTWHLGFAPGKSMLVNHLVSKGYLPQELIDANVAVAGKDGKLRDRFFNRIMFPIQNEKGDVIAFGGRVVGKGEPKYLNSQETPLFHKSNVLYGLFQAKASITASGEAIVVEGYTDVISLHQAGVRNVVATLGTSLTEQHVRLLSRYAKSRIVYLFDGDEAGQRAADRALGFISSDMLSESGANNAELYAVTLPDNLDPADFIEKRGKEELDTLLKNAEPLIRYGIQRKLSSHHLSTAEDRAAALSDALSILAPIKNSALAKDYARFLAMNLMMREDDVLDSLGKLREPKVYERRESVVSPPVRSEVKLSQAEVNRRRIERDFLAHMIAAPQTALQWAHVLAQAQWHTQRHAQIAQCILASLSENPNVTAPELVSILLKSVERVQDVVFDAGKYARGNWGDSIAFLAEELELGDLQNQIRSLQNILEHDAKSADAEFSNALFAELASMQNRVHALKSRHVALF